MDDNDIKAQAEQLGLREGLIDNLKASAKTLPWTRYPEVAEHTLQNIVGRLRQLSSQRGPYPEPDRSTYAASALSPIVRDAQRILQEHEERLARHHGIEPLHRES